MSGAAEPGAVPASPRPGRGDDGGVSASPQPAWNDGDVEFTLLELADRLLNRGVVLVGEATISVAGVDLIYLGLNVVLTAVENLRRPAPARPE